MIKPETNFSIISKTLEKFTKANQILWLINDKIRSIIGNLDELKIDDLSEKSLNSIRIFAATRTRNEFTQLSELVDNINNAFNPDEWGSNKEQYLRSLNRSDNKLDSLRRWALKKTFSSSDLVHSTPVLSTLKSIAGDIPILKHDEVEDILIHNFSVKIGLAVNIPYTSPQTRSLAKLVFPPGNGFEPLIPPLHQSSDGDEIPIPAVRDAGHSEALFISNPTEWLPAPTSSPSNDSSDDGSD